jgi:hypothetical protein
MACSKYHVYEYDAYNCLHDTGKEFCVSIKEMQWMCFSLYGCQDPPSSEHNGRCLMMVFFNKVFGFTYDSGHLVRIVDDSTTDIYWRGNIWRLVKKR